MNCGVGCDPEQNGRRREVLERINAKIIQKRIPINGCIELTTRCNLNCRHCYVSNKEQRESRNQTELSPRQWMDLIDQFAEAGCLYLLFSGGEALLREDFSEIYRYACKKGLLVTVFTNGTLVSDRVIEAFKEYPPYCIEISIYGATKTTYENVTGVSGSFEKCMNGISRIKDNGFRLKLKTMLLTINKHELEEIQEIAAGMGLPFRFDAAVSPRLNGDKTPLVYRVTAKEAVTKELLDRTRVGQWHDLYQRMKKQAASLRLYSCGAGVNMFHVDPAGMMRPCFMITKTAHDLSGSNFKNIWYCMEFSRFREEGDPPASCQDCDKKPLCGYCPSFFKLETGNERILSTYLCEIGMERKQMIESFLLEKNNYGDK